MVVDWTLFFNEQGLVFGFKFQMSKHAKFESTWRWIQDLTLDREIQIKIKSKNKSTGLQFILNTFCDCILIKIINYFKK